MSTDTQLHRHSDTASPTPVLAALGAATAAILTAIGTFVDVLGREEQRTDTMADFYSWMVIVGVIAVATALIFGLVVRGATPRNATGRALVLSILAVPTVLVAWTGLPPVLASAAVACALVARGRTGHFGVGRQDGVGAGWSRDGRSSRLRPRRVTSDTCRGHRVTPR